MDAKDELKTDAAKDLVTLLEMAGDLLPYVLAGFAVVIVPAAAFIAYTIYGIHKDRKAMRKRMGLK